MGLGYTDFKQLKLASGEWRLGLQMLEAVGLGVGIITSYKMVPGPIQVFNVCIGELMVGLSDRGLTVGGT